jgi:hypothetical protein
MQGQLVVIPSASWTTHRGVLSEIPCHLSHSSGLWARSSASWTTCQGLARYPLPAGPIFGVPAAALDPLAPVTLEPAAIRGEGALAIPVPVVTVPAATADCVCVWPQGVEGGGRAG